MDIRASAISFSGYEKGQAKPLAAADCGYKLQYRQRLIWRKTKKMMHIAIYRHTNINGAAAF